MASDFEKPNKIHTLFKEEIETKMWPLPIENLFFLGKSSAKKLREIGIKTIFDIAHANPNTLKNLLKSHGETLYNYANGIDNSIINTEQEAPKSISNSHTTEYDLSNRCEILELILALCNKTATRLRAEKMKCKTITVTLKTNLFKTYSRSYTLSTYTNVTKDIYSCAKNIFETMYNNIPVRLIGVGLSNLTADCTTQLSIFDTEKTKEFKVDKVVDELLAKFNNDTLITRASCIKTTRKK
ncbi:MAG: hypothetical protein IKV94_04360 [Clostridia bacterium]|nr:hypothetical protein [Clostridia bacterium]